MDDLKDIVLNVGAFAGFAAIVGLAVLAMLYFSQARDVRRLREWAGRAPERDAEVELLAQQMATKAVADMVAAMPEAEAPLPPSQPPPLDATIVAVAPAVGESTEWSPDQPAEEHEVDEAALASPDLESPEPKSPEPESTEPEPIEAVLAAAGDGTPGESPLDADGVAAENALEPPAGEEDAEVPLTAAGTAAASAAGVSQPTEEVNVLELEEEHEPPAETRPSRLAPSTPAAARTAAPGTGVTSTGVTSARLPLPPLPEARTTAAETVGAGGYSATALSHETTFSEFETERNRAERSSSGSRAPFYVAGILVAAFGVLLIYTQLGGSDSTEKADTTSAKQTEADRRKTTGANPRINRAGVQVVVLNGTSISGLAAVVGDQVDQAGFTLKSVANRGDNQDHIESVVYYAPGKKPEAEEVAKELQIDSIKEVDEATAAASGNAPVVVVTGSDREQ